VSRRAAGALALSVGWIAAGPGVVRAQTGLHIDGAAIASNVVVRVSCSAAREGRSRASCEVSTELTIEATESTRLCPSSCGPGFYAPLPILVEGALLRSPRMLAPGQRVSASVTNHFELSTERGADSLITQPGLGLRHPFLGESWLDHGTARHVVRQVTGDRVTLDGAVRVERGDHERIRARLQPTGDGSPPAVEVELRPPHGGPPEGPLAHGGPAITLGGRIHEGRAGFLLGVGYELGLVEHLILSAWFETDFEDHLSEAVLIEAVSPGAIFIWPSLGAGIGPVFRQLGNFGSDAGLRIRLTGAFFVTGLVADFDYWGIAGEWTFTVSARLGI